MRLSRPGRCAQTRRCGPDKTRAPAHSCKGEEECLARKGNRSEAEKRVPPGHAAEGLGGRFCGSRRCRFAMRDALVASGAVRANTPMRTRQNPPARAFVQRKRRIFGPGGQPQRSGEAGPSWLRQLEIQRPNARAVPWASNEIGLVWQGAVGISSPHGFSPGDDFARSRPSISAHGT